MEHGTAQRVNSGLPANGQPRKERCAEVSTPIRERGNGCDAARDELRFAVLLEAEEEERLVVTVVKFPEQNWSAHREAIVVLALGVTNVLPRLGKVIRDSGSICKGRTGIQKLVYQIIVGSSVKLVRSGFHRVVEIPASSLSILSGIVARLDCHFLDRVNTGLIDLVLLAPHTVGCILPFDANGL